MHQTIRPGKGKRSKFHSIRYEACRVYWTIVKHFYVELDTVWIYCAQLPLFNFKKRTVKYSRLVLTGHITINLTIGETVITSLVMGCIPDYILRPYI